MNNGANDRAVVDQSIITSAVEHLRKGELVAFPTETVYGLGADASNETALQKLYAVKGRPANHPVIVHLASAKQMHNWAIEVSDYAEKLAQHFWPGPLTLIVKKSQPVSALVTGGQDTVGLRVPAHPIALALLEEFGAGIAAPSANKYGRISSTCAKHVQAEFGNEIKLVIDGGSCLVGIESTIIDTTGEHPRILRPGIISEKEILECLELDESESKNITAQNDHDTKHVRVPGSDKTHYAPQTPMFLLDKEAIEQLLMQPNGKESYAVLSFAKPNVVDKLMAGKAIRILIKAPSDPKLYAHELYDNLHRLDNSGVTKILIEAVPESAAWAPINDRLKRAAKNK